MKQRHDCAYVPLTANLQITHLVEYDSFVVRLAENVNLYFVPIFMHFSCVVTHHPGGPDAAGVLRKGGGDSTAESAGSGSETRGSAAESRRAGDASLQEGTPYCRAKEVPRGRKMSSKVSTRIQTKREFNVTLFCIT